MFKFELLLSPLRKVLFFFILLCYKKRNTRYTITFNLYKSQFALLLGDVTLVQKYNIHYRTIF